MTRFLIDLACRILPPHRREWGDAMRAEFAAIPPRDALGFALGCLWAALTIRITAMQLITAIGRFGVGIVTLLYSGLFLWGVVNQLSHTDGRAMFDQPLMYAWTLSMGLTHACAGIFLIRWTPKLFFTSCIAACGPVLALTLGGALSRHMPHVLSYAWPCVPLALLVTAALFLDWLSREPQRPAIA